METRRPDVLKNSPIKGAGMVPAKVVRCRVLRCNTQNHTVDLASTHDRHTFLDVPVGMPYAHFRGGAGWYGHPLEKAICYVTIPSDSTPPFAHSFVSPMRARAVGGKGAAAQGGTAAQVNAGERADAAGETDDRPTATVPSFDVNREEADEGDFFWKGSDGNFIILRASGILEIGCSSLSKRIYLPLGDKIADLFQEYEALSPGGSIHWGIQQRAHDPVEHTQCFRLYAGDKHADVRIRHGGLSALGEPDGDKGESVKLTELGIGVGDGNEVCIEVAISQDGFSPEQQGQPVSDAARQASVMRYFFDRKGGAFLRAEGSGLVSFRKNLTIKVGETFSLQAKKLAITATEEMRMDGGKALNLSGGTIQFNGGGRAVAAAGDQVIIPVPSAAITGTVAGQPFVGVLTLATGSLIGIIQGVQQQTVRVP